MHAKHAWVLQTVRELLDKHGLPHWTVGFNNRKTMLGRCLFHRKLIELSRPYVDHNDEESIRDTILHEIAHALVGPEHGHNPVWMSKALEIGATPTRCCKDSKIPGRWQARCCNCGRTHHKHRAPKRGRSYHCKCSEAAPALTWKQLIHQL
jgi:predicted SprT family Zn-dependent metalloprotease